MPSWLGTAVDESFTVTVKCRLTEDGTYVGEAKGPTERKQCMCVRRYFGEL